MLFFSTKTYNKPNLVRPFFGPTHTENLVHWTILFLLSFFTTRNQLISTYNTSNSNRIFDKKSVGNIPASAFLMVFRSNSQLKVRWKHLNRVCSSIKTPSETSPSSAFLTIFQPNSQLKDRRKHPNRVYFPIETPSKTFRPSAFSMVFWRNSRLKVRRKHLNWVLQSKDRRKHPLRVLFRRSFDRIPIQKISRTGAFLMDFRLIRDRKIDWFLVAIVFYFFLLVITK